MQSQSFGTRCLAALVIALAVISVDHAAKLGAAALESADYTHNPTPVDYDWLLPLPFLVLLFPSRLLAAAFGLWLGGSASNIIDSHLWPGGVPDFIPLGDWILNPADFTINAGAIALAILVVGWPVLKLFLIARRQYPDPNRAEALDLHNPKTPNASDAAAVQPRCTTARE